MHTFARVPPGQYPSGCSSWGWAFAHLVFQSEDSFNGRKHCWVPHNAFQSRDLGYSVTRRLSNTKFFSILLWCTWQYACLWYIHQSNDDTFCHQERPYFQGEFGSISICARPRFPRGEPIPWPQGEQHHQEMKVRTRCPTADFTWVSPLFPLTSFFWPQTHSRIPLSM